MCSESNAITIDVDLSAQQSVVNAIMQTDLVPNCRCDEAMAAKSRLSESMQTLSRRVDASFQMLTGQLNLALDAIVSLNSYHPQVLNYMALC